MRIIFALIIGMCVFTSFYAKAQMSSTKTAQYLATVTAVSAYKIDDEENLKNVEKLRQDKRFNEKLQAMMAKLDNSKTKNNKNQQILKILEKAGKDIYDILN